MSGRATASGPSAWRTISSNRCFWVESRIWAMLLSDSWRIRIIPCGSLPPPPPASAPAHLAGHAPPPLPGVPGQVVDLGLLLLGDVQLLLHRGSEQDHGQMGSLSDPPAQPGHAGLGRRGHVAASRDRVPVRFRLRVQNQDRTPTGPRGACTRRSSTGPIARTCRPPGRLCECETSGLPPVRSSWGRLARLFLALPTSAPIVDELRWHRKP